MCVCVCVCVCLFSFHQRMSQHKAHTKSHTKNAQNILENQRLLRIQSINGGYIKNFDRLGRFSAWSISFIQKTAKLTDELNTKSFI